MKNKKTIKKRKLVHTHTINAEQKELKVHAIECPKCGDVVFSRAVHDYRACTCGEVAIDGGFDYQKIAFRTEPPKDVEMWISVSAKDLYKDWNLGEDKYGLQKPEGQGIIVSRSHGPTG